MLKGVEVSSKNSAGLPGILNTEHLTVNTWLLTTWLQVIKN